MKCGRNLHMLGVTNWLCFHKKLEEPTISNYTVEKEGMINFYQSTRCHNQHDGSLYRHYCEILKYHSKAKSATIVSSSLHMLGSCNKFFIILKIKVIVNKQ